MSPSNEDWIDERIPICEVCGTNQGTRRVCNGDLAGKLICQDCYEDWLMGRYDQPEPPGEGVNA